MKINDVKGKKSRQVKEGYTVLPAIDRDRYGERSGLEGPFQTRHGKVLYYDPREGAYYDPDTDMFLSYDEWRALDEDETYQPKGKRGPTQKDWFHMLKSGYTIDPNGIETENFGDEGWRNDVRVLNFTVYSDESGSDIGHGQLDDYYRTMRIDLHTGQHVVIDNENHPLFKDAASILDGELDEGIKPNDSARAYQAQMDQAHSNIYPGKQKPPASLMKAIRDEEKQRKKRKVKESGGTTHYLITDGGDQHFVLDYPRTPGSNPQHLRIQIDNAAKEHGFKRSKVVAYWSGDIDQEIEQAREIAASWESKKDRFPTQYYDNIKKAEQLERAKEIMGEAVVEAESTPEKLVQDFLKNSVMEADGKYQTGDVITNDEGTFELEVHPDGTIEMFGGRDGDEMQELEFEPGTEHAHYRHVVTNGKRDFVRVDEGKPTSSDYAIGMSQAMKSTGDKKPLKKSTIKKAHRIARAVANEDEQLAEYRPGVTVLTRELSFADLSGSHLDGHYDPEAEYNTIKKIRWPYGVEVSFNDRTRTVRFKTAKMKTVAKLLDRHVDFGAISAAEALDLPMELMMGETKIAEGMPSGVIKHKQRLAQMTNQELAKHLAGKSETELRQMAWRHGYGKMSDHYLRRVRAVANESEDDGVEYNGVKYKKDSKGFWDPVNNRRIRFPEDVKDAKLRRILFPDFPKQLGETEKLSHISAKTSTVGLAQTLSKQPMGKVFDYSIDLRTGHGEDDHHGLYELKRRGYIKLKKVKDDWPILHFEVKVVKPMLEENSGLGTGLKAFKRASSNNKDPRMMKLKLMLSSPEFIEQVARDPKGQPTLGDRVFLKMMRALGIPNEGDLQRRIARKLIASGEYKKAVSPKYNMSAYSDDEIKDLYQRYIVKGENPRDDLSLDDVSDIAIRAVKRANGGKKLSGIGWTKDRNVAVKDMDGKTWTYDPVTGKVSSGITEGMPDMGKVVTVFKGGNKVAEFKLPARAMVHHVDQELRKLGNSIPMRDVARMNVARDLAAGKTAQFQDLTFKLAGNQPREMR